MDENTVKSCLTCRHKHVCLQRGMAIFMLFINTHRYDEAEAAEENLDVSAGCQNYEVKENSENAR